MSIKVMTFYWDQETLRENELLCMLALADWSNIEGECWPSVSSLADRIRVSRRSAFDILRRLEEKGEIVRETGAGRKTQGGSTNKYRLIRYIKHINGDARSGEVAAQSGDAGLTTLQNESGEVAARSGEVAARSGEAASSTDPLEPSVEPLEPSEGETRANEPILFDIPVSPPSPSANGHQGRSRKKQNIDPRKIGANGLIPSGRGETVLEIYREGFAVSPTAFQIQTMNDAVTDLEKWRKTVHQCAARGFRTVANVIDVYQNGFREKSSNGYRNGNQPQRGFLAARNDRANPGHSAGRGAGTNSGESANGARKRTQWRTPEEFLELDPEIQQFLIAAKRRDPAKYADVPDL